MLLLFWICTHQVTVKVMVQKVAYTWN